MCMLFGGSSVLEDCKDAGNDLIVLCEGRAVIVVPIDRLLIG